MTGIIHHLFPVAKNQNSSPAVPNRLWATLKNRIFSLRKSSQA